MDKRYQVFVSSTYADLKDERRAVIQALMEMDCIPAGMELFPAADEEQLSFIKKIIDDCDYYLLIIGGRYGSLTSEGISYTEQEYDYAISKGLAVIGFLHQRPDDIPLGKSEATPNARALLAAFRDKVSTGRLVKYWTTATELPGLVVLSLTKTIKTHPARGWIRADRVASEDLLQEINAVRKANLALSEELARVRPVATKDLDLAGLDEVVAVSGTYFFSGRKGEWKATPTWRAIFGLLSPYLISHPSDSSIKTILETEIFKSASYKGTSVSINDQDFRTISVQLRALGLVSIRYAQTTSGGMGLFWSATPDGEQLTFELRTVKRAIVRGSSPV